MYNEAVRYNHVHLKHKVVGRFDHQK